MPGLAALEAVQRPHQARYRGAHAMRWHRTGWRHRQHVPRDPTTHPLPTWLVAIGTGDGTTPRVRHHHRAAARPAKG
jgi:hypothetical protein